MNRLEDLEESWEQIEIPEVQ